MTREGNGKNGLEELPDPPVPGLIDTPEKQREYTWEYFHWLTTVVRVLHRNQVKTYKAMTAGPRIVRIQLNWPAGVLGGLTGGGGMFALVQYLIDRLTGG